MKPDTWIADTIRSYGWAVTYVMGTDYLPSFCYTTGLKELGHPEIIIFGLSRETLMAVLNTAGELVRTGQRLTTGHQYGNFFNKGHTCFLPVDPRSVRYYFGRGTEHYGNDHFAALQMVWQDRQERYPWEPAFEEEFRYRQPLLDRDADFKFREAENCGVFTSRQILEDAHPVLEVYHDEDGDWQFLTGEETEEDLVLVALKEMVTMEAGLNDLFNLDFGEWACRSAPGEKWQRRHIAAEDSGEDDDQ